MPRDLGIETLWSNLSLQDHSHMVGSRLQLFLEVSKKGRLTARLRRERVPLIVTSVPRMLQPSAGMAFPSSLLNLHQVSLRQILAGTQTMPPLFLHVSVVAWVKLMAKSIWQNKS